MFMFRALLIAAVVMLGVVVGAGATGGGHTVNVELHAHSGDAPSDASVTCHDGVLTWTQTSPTTGVARCLVVVAPTSTQTSTSIPTITPIPTRTLVPTETPFPPVKITSAPFPR